MVNNKENNMTCRNRITLMNGMEIVGCPFETDDMEKEQEFRFKIVQDIDIRKACISMKMNTGSFTLIPFTNVASYAIEEVK